MNTVTAAPPIPFANTISRIAPAPSSILPSPARESNVTTPNQQPSPTIRHQDFIHSNTTTTTTNSSVENDQQPQQQPATTTPTQTEAPTMNSTDPASDMNQVASISCMNCGTTTTPLWRRAPNGDTICNACGLYLKARHTFRPTTMKRNVQPKKRQQQQLNSDTAPAGATASTGGCNSNNGTSGSTTGSCPGGGRCNGTGGSSSCAGCPTFNNQQLRRKQEEQLDGLVCANCATTTTPLWRRDDQGNTICNACGLYYKLHHVHRPVSMKRSVIKRRRRLIVMGDSGDGHGDGDENDDDELISVNNDEQQQRSNTETTLEYDQQQPNSAAPKKIRKPYRKRIKANDGGSDQQAKGKRNRKDVAPHQPPSSPSTARSALSVPAIEDYIVPKRTGLPVTPPSSNPSSHTSATSSLNGIQQLSPYQHPFYPHPPSHLSLTRTNNSPSSLSLPPISSERRSAHFDPFYRDGRARSPMPSSSSPSTTANTPLPPISLPPLLRPTATTPSTTTAIINSTNSNNEKSAPLHQLNSTSVTSSTHSIPLPPSPNSTGSSSTFTSTKQPTEMEQHTQQQYSALMELEDWDEALKNLQLLRKKVQPEHVRALAQLSKPLWDMVSKAQSIVHGTGALSHP